MSQTSRCAGCGSDRLSPPTRLLSQNSPSLEFFKAGTKRGFFADDTVGARITRARICLGCGLVMLYVPPEDLAKFVAHEGKLEPKGAAADEQ